MYCPRCGKRPPHGATYCHACGTKMPTGHLCVQCGGEVDGRTLLCKRCQRPLTSPPAVPAPQTPSAPAMAAPPMPSADGGSHPSRTERFSTILLGIAGVVVALAIALFIFGRHERIHDPAPAATRLKAAGPILNRSDVVYAVERDGTVIEAPLNTALMRELTRQRATVDPRPDYPGWLPIIALVVLAGTVVVKSIASRLLPLALAVATLTTLYVVHWSQGAAIDLTEVGINKRAYETMPKQWLSSMALWERLGMAPPDAWRVQLQITGHIAEERQRTFSMHRRWMTLDFLLRAILGLSLLAAIVGRVRRALAEGRPTARGWIALLFAILLLQAAAVIVHTEAGDPARRWWLYFMGAIWVCWGGCHLACTAARPRLLPRVTPAAAALLLFMLPASSFAQDDPARKAKQALDLFKSISETTTQIIATEQSTEFKKRACDVNNAYKVNSFRSHYESGAPIHAHVLVDESDGCILYIGEASRGRTTADLNNDAFIHRPSGSRWENRQWIGTFTRSSSGDVCTPQDRPSSPLVMRAAPERGTWIVERRGSGSRAEVKIPLTPNALYEVAVSTGTTHTDLSHDPSPPGERILELLISETDPAFEQYIKFLDSTRQRLERTPPASPGGIALGTRLELPPEAVSVDGIAYYGGSVYLEGPDGSWLLPDVNPRDLATVLRSVLYAGEVPILSIGTERSDRPNHAAVTYFGGIRNTVIGEAMLAADLRFKAAFLRFGLGPRGSRVGAADVDGLFERFPGIGGDGTRMWIVGSTATLAADPSKPRRLVLAKSGLSVLSETTLRGFPEPDPAIESYCADLTRSWDRLAAAVPEYREMERLVVLSALASWARARRAYVSPHLLLLPPRIRPTPSHVPVLAAAAPDGSISVTGGVSLAPEMRFAGSGRAILRQVKSWMGGLSTAGRIGTCLLIIVVLAALAIGPGLVLHAALKGDRRRTILAWAGTVACTFLALAAVSPSVGGRLLDEFDAEWLRWMVAFVLPPVLLGAWLRRISEKSAPKTSLVLGLLTHAVVCALATGLALLTSALAPAILEEDVAPVIVQLEIAPAESVAAISSSYDHGTGQVTHGPATLLRAQRYPLRLEASGEAPGDELSQSREAADPALPWTWLRRIPWREGHEGWSHYSPSGEPPY